MSVMWNMWHGCTRYSEGCKYCYVYRGDESRGLDASVVKKTAAFDLIERKDRYGQYKIRGGETVFMCFSSDFLLEEADEWRGEIFAMMRRRPELNYFFITKRILRLQSVLPPDWGDGWDNVRIGVTCENERRLKERMPCFLSLPVKRRALILEPFLSEMDIREFISGGGVEEVVAGGESGENARPVDYDWILKVRRACEDCGVTFRFKQTGARFIKNGVCYRIKRADQHRQAKKAGIDFIGGFVPEDF